MIDSAALLSDVLEAVPGAYRTADNLTEALDPRVYAARCLEMPEHAELLAGNAAIDFVFRMGDKVKAGKRILGTCCIPKVQGDLNGLFLHLLEGMLGRIPDFLVVLDWSYWVDASERAREILVFHELRHARQAVDAFGGPKFDRGTGEPVWRLVAHDIEEFDDVVRRYGMHSEDLERFFQAVTDHLESPQ